MRTLTAFVQCCVSAVLILSLGCGDDSKRSGPMAGDGGSSGTGGSLDGGGGSAGDLDASNLDASDGSSGGGGTAGSGGTNALVNPVPDYGVPTIEPDTSTAKVDDCVGAPDMTLCDVVTVPDRWYDVCVAGVCVSPGCGEQECNTPGVHFPIPPFEGHVYLEKQPGNEPVTIDKITGLHWTSCAAGMTGAGCDAGTPLEAELPQALAYCDELTWGGHDDWYLPDIFELTSLADLTADRSMTGSTDFLDDRAFPNQPAVDAFYWSTTHIDNNQRLFSTGQNEGGFRSIVDAARFPPHSVLCVRRGFSKAMPEGERFVSHDDAPVDEPWVEDRATGLVFQGCSSDTTGACGGMFTGAEAIAHCVGLSWGGADDWRVPTYKEMQSVFDVLDVDVFDPGLSEALFGELQGTYVLTTPGPLLSMRDMERVGIGIAANTYPLLCVRGP